MTSNDRRTDSTTSMKIAFAFRIKRALGPDAASNFVAQQRIEENLAKAILSEATDRRQQVRRVNRRSLPRTNV